MSLLNHTPELSFLLNQLFQPFPSACLVTHDGQILGAKFETLTDIGTFAPVIETIAKYFVLNEGDVIATNDPNSGSPLLNVLTIVTPVHFKEGQEFKYFLLARKRLTPVLVGQEVLRIPPTPVVQDKVWNENILSILAQHPESPRDLTDHIRSLTDLALQQIQLFKSWLVHRPHCFSRGTQKSLLLETRERLLRKISDVPRGEKQMEVRFPTGEVIRLKTEVKSNEIHFDFAGTSSSSNLYLNETVTFGICLGAVLAFLEENHLLNSGAFPLISITTPQGCMLSSKSIPHFQGSIEVSLFLGLSVLQSFSQVVVVGSVGAHRSIPVNLNFDFGDGKNLFRTIASGTAADTQRNGLDAYYYWSLGKKRSPIENTEKQFPVTIRQASLRKSSGGTGKNTGGNGSIEEIEVLRDCQFSWLQGFKNFQVKGVKVSDTGKPAEIVVVSKSGEKLVLQDRLGQMKLTAGDKVLAMSAGGSGFGKADVEK
jgi:5-oxoprolinase (ATP-hydrolysing)